MHILYLIEHTFTNKNVCCLAMPRLSTQMNTGL